MLGSDADSDVLCRRCWARGAPLAEADDRAAAREVSYTSETETQALASGGLPTHLLHV